MPERIAPLIIGAPNAARRSSTNAVTHGISSRFDPLKFHTSEWCGRGVEAGEPHGWLFFHTFHTFHR
jgi:hypothetical protein